jgi:hypothetical protein
MLLRYRNVDAISSHRGAELGLIDSSQLMRVGSVAVRAELFGLKSAVESRKVYHRTGPKKGPEPSSWTMSAVTMIVLTVCVNTCPLTTPKFL